MNTQEIRPFIGRLAEVSGTVIRDYFMRAELAVEYKKDASPVTLADRGAEQVMRDLIKRQYPSHGVIAEEFGNENEDAEWVWVLDPIDGTISFTAGCPLFGTLIGLLHNGKPVAGCIHQPVLEQLLLGDSEGTTLNGKAVRARSTMKLEDATLLTTDMSNIDLYQDEALFERLRRRCKIFRTWGDCYGYFLVCTGGADIMCDPILNPWDLLPLIPVLRGAGVEVSDWSGNEVDVGTRSLLAAPMPLHRAAKRVLNPE